MADARTTSTSGSTMSGWARTADYLFGRNALIGLASLMLLLISGYATWHGMRDFIVGVSTSSANVATQGGLSISNDVLVIAVVIALSFLMWLALRETFGAQRRVTERMITFPLYLFLAVGRSASAMASGGASSPAKRRRVPACKTSRRTRATPLRP